MAARKSILGWVQNELGHPPYNQLKIDDLTVCFKDGRALCALLHILSPGSFSWDEVMSASPTDNSNRALLGLEREYGIPKLMDAEDIVTTPDDKGMQLYLSYVIDAFNKKFGRDPGTPYMARTPAQSRAGSSTDASKESAAAKEAAKGQSRLAVLKVGGHTRTSSAPMIAHKDDFATKPVEEKRASTRVAHTLVVEERPIKTASAPDSSAKEERTGSVLDRYKPQQQQPGAFVVGRQDDTSNHAEQPVKSVLDRYKPQGTALATGVRSLGTPATTRISTAAASSPAPLRDPHGAPLAGHSLAEAAPVPTPAAVASSAPPVIVAPPLITLPPVISVPSTEGPSLREKELMRDLERLADELKVEKKRHQDEKKSLEAHVAELTATLDALTAKAGPDVAELRAQIEDLETTQAMYLMSLEDARASQKKMEEERAELVERLEHKHPQKARLGESTLSPGLDEKALLQHELREWERRALAAEKALEELKKK